MTKNLAERERQRQEAKRKNLVRRWKKRTLWIIPLLALSVWIVYAALNAPPTTVWPYGNVHWHARFDISVCGETRSLEHLGGPNSHYGGPVVHTHGDNQLHVEGNPGSLESASLGAFFKAINVPFSEQGIFEYSDGTVCPGQSTNQMEVLVNDVPVRNATGYVPKDDDVITIIYQ